MQPACSMHERQAVILTKGHVLSSSCDSIPVGRRVSGRRHASVPAPDATAISGTVVDSSGRAVQGARVALVPMGLFDPSGARFVQVESAADGSFRFAGVAAGRYGVTATAPDHTAAWVADVEAGRAGLRLQLSNGGRRLSGRVRDRSGRPRAGAEVRLARGLGDNGDVFLVESAADGRWNAMVPEGHYSANAVLGSDYAAAPRAAAGGSRFRRSGTGCRLASRPAAGGCRRLGARARDSTGHGRAGSRSCRSRAASRHRGGCACRRPR